MSTLNSSTELTYTVRGGDGKEYGPVSYDQVIAWSRDGRVQALSELRRSDMQHWAHAGDFTELKTCFPTTPPPTLDAPTAGASVAPVGPATFAQLKSGASWFYWIAGLSLINSISAFSGSDWRFIVGLGITQVFDAMAPEFGTAGKAIVLLLDVLAAGTLVLFGVFANKGHLWAFITGMVLFALDGIIFLVGQEWLGVGFHAFVLFCLFRGAKAARALKA